MTRHVLRIFALLMFLLVAGCGADPLPTTGAVRRVDLVQAQEIFEAGDAVIIDLRTPEEFAAGHLEGAQLINIYDDDFRAQIDVLDRSAFYLIHCAQGGRSGSAAGIFRELGFENVADMTDGMNGWQAAGLPTVT